MAVVAKVILGFFRGLWTLAPPWRLWIGLLILVNGVVPLFYLDTLEGRVVLAALVGGAIVQMVIFGAVGFVRLLGLGHLVAWLPMLLWLWPRLAPIGLESGFGKWLAAVVVLDLASLSIDAVDVIRYALGDRRPSLTLEEL